MEVNITKTETTYYNIEYTRSSWTDERFGFCKRNLQKK